MKLRKLFKQLKREKLLPDEKKHILAAIVEAQRQFPAHVVTKSTRWAFWRITWTGKFALATLSILLALGTTSGTALAAESALPGDILYPIKINITERARLAVAISVQSKAVVQERLAERRMEELEKMAERGRLTAEKETKITAQFDAHKAEMEKNIVRLEAASKNTPATVLRARLNNFTEIKEAKIIKTLNIQLNEEIKQKIKIQEKTERREERLDTEAAIRASIKNELKIKLENQREERRLEQERERQDEQKLKKSDDTSPSISVDTDVKLKIDVKEKSRLAPHI